MTPVDAVELRRAFCARLKTERERHGVTLAAIADATKVNATLLQALERGDLSRWPKGIYRRAFFRDYATAIGLPVESCTSEFLELFPDGDAGPSTGTPAKNVEPSGAGSLRLTLAGSAPETRPMRRLRRGRSPIHCEPVRAVAAAMDAGAIIVLALLLSWSLALGSWQTVTVVALMYFTLSTLFLGRSAASWFLARRRWAAAPADDVAAPAMGLRPGVLARPALRDLVGQAFRHRSALREYLSSLSYSPSLSARTWRRRDFVGVRRRRVDASSAPSSDKAGVMS